MMLTVRYHGMTDQGRIRPNNEDAWRAEPALGLFVLSDGMGGMAAGEVASAMVVEGAAGLLKEPLSAPGMDAGGIEALLKNVLVRLSDEIREAGLRNSAQRGMGATAVLALIREERIHVAHVGDSRAWLVRGGKLFQLTRDHSYAQQLIDEGLLDPRETRGHPGRFQLTQCMGMIGVPRPGFHSMELSPGDRILLSSDGLSDMLDPGDIESLAAKAIDPADACRKLVRAANEAGGHDNITVVVLDMAGD